MEIKIYEDYQSLSEHAGDYAFECLSAADRPLLCPASGDSPTGTYRRLAAHAGPAGGRDWRLVSLDEWVGLNGSDPGSCRHYIDQELFGPLQPPKENYFFFDGRSPDLAAECRQADEFIKNHGGIHLAILGVGMNGHAGFNEPGIDPGLGAHVARLDATTITVGQKYFSAKMELSQGITIGLKWLLAAKHLLVIASGEKKAAILRAVLQGPASNEVPASLLRAHPGISFFLDRGAASLL